MTEAEMVRLVVLAVLSFTGGVAGLVLGLRDGGRR